MDTQALIEVRRKKKETALKRYWEVVRLDAQDRGTLKPADADVMLSEAGVSIEQFANDIANMRERYRLAKLVADAKGAREQSQAVDKEMHEKKAAFLESKQAHEAELRRLGSIRNQHDSAADAGRNAEIKLLATCDPALRKEESQLVESIETLKRNYDVAELNLKRYHAEHPPRGTLLLGGLTSPGPNAATVHAAEAKMKRMRTDQKGYEEALRENRRKQLEP